MDHLQTFITQVRRHLFVVLLVNNATLVGLWWYGSQVLHVSPLLILIALGAFGLIITIVCTFFSAAILTQPMRLLWQAILHISPHTANTPAPNLKHAHLGRELVTTLISNMYQLASVVDDVEKLASKTPHNLSADFVANALPLPMTILNKDGMIVYANEAMLTMLHKAKADVQGQNVYLMLDMSFSNEHTFDEWLEQAKANKVTASKTWERIRLNVEDEKEQRLCDLVAYYNKNNPEDYEIMLVLFDRTRQYSQDDQALSFVALAVHELRTPLTLLRGYVEAFEEDLQGQLTPEIAGYVHKMKAAAQKLAAFTSNILNVARFENDQLVLKLHEEQWAPLLKSAVDDMQLRAEIEGINLTFKVEDKMPTVGVDAVSIYEVICNLIDNAIKYSGESKEIIISSYVANDGTIETTVQDFGVGVPENAVPNLFDKFYRNYRNRAQVGGTGMGLYLSKAIVGAHGGNIWVRAKEGEGSTFGFTISPYSKLAAELKNDNNTGKNITRTAHGWIKNHSMYRR